MISVIIPVGAGRGENLSLALCGLSQQTYRDFEVVLVTNDKEIATRFDAHYVHHEKPNIGSINRNAGVRLANYDRLVFIDSDIILHPNALQFYADGFDNYRNRAILGLYHWLPPMKVTKDDVARWDTIETLPSASVNHHYIQDSRTAYFESTHPDRLYCDYQRALHCLSGNMGISRTCFEHAGGFDEELSRAEDGAFGLALCDAGHSWSYDKRIVGLHLSHPQFTPAFAYDPFPRIIERWHSDNSWLGRMTWGKTWEWKE